MSTPRIYLGYDNPLKLAVYQEGRLVDLSTVSSMTAKLHNASLSSSNSASAFDWQTNNGYVVLKLGTMSGLSLGIQTLELIAKSPTWTNGVVLGTIQVEVK